jgi:hypothetical protein
MDTFQKTSKCLQLAYFTMLMPIEGVQSLGFENESRIWCE